MLPSEHDRLLSTAQLIHSQRERSLLPFEGDDKLNLTSWDGLCSFLRSKRGWMAGSYFGVTAMGGALLVLTSLSMSKFALMLSEDTSALSKLWIFKALGSLSGICISAVVMQAKGSATVSAFISSSVTCLSIVCIVVPTFEGRLTEGMLCAFYLIIGLCATIMDVGVSIQSRRIHADEAGAWLSANTICFALGCQAVAMLQFWFSDRQIFITVGAFGIIVTAASLVSAILPAPVTPSKSLPLIAKAQASEKDASKSAKKLQDFYVFEALFGVILFWVFGSKIACSAYLHLYLKDEFGTSRILRKYELLILVIWSMTSIARVYGVFDTARLPFWQVTPVLGRGSGAMLLTLMSAVVLAIFSERFTFFWVTIVCYFTVSGPALGYTYELNHRVTIQSARGTSILKLGFQMGTSLVPFATAILWHSYGPAALRIVLIAGSAIPMLVFEGTRRYVQMMASRTDLNVSHTGN